MHILRGFSMGCLQRIEVSGKFEEFALYRRKQKLIVRFNMEKHKSQEKFFGRRFRGLRTCPPLEGMELRVYSDPG